MTALESDALTDDLADRLDVLDRALDRLSAVVSQTGDVGPPVEVATLVTRVADELDELTRDVDRHEVEDFAAARTAVAIRRDRFGFLRAALEAQRDEAPRTHLVGPAAGADAALDAALTGPGTGRRPTPSGPAGSIGRVLSIAGLVLVAFFLYQVTASGIVHRRHQTMLLDRFRAEAPEQAYYPTTGEVGVDGEEAAPDGLLTSEEAAGEEVVDQGPEIVAAAEAPSPGTPVALIQIPTIDVEEVVVQGTSAAQLRQGPGHLRGTPMPGEPGNVGIAGARLANGGPFRNLDDLEEGDRIDLTSAVGRFEYRVRSVERVQEGDPDPVRATGEGNIVTLVTSAPMLLATERLVVVAELRSAPVPPRYRTVAPTNTETGLDTTPGGIGPVVGWGIALAVAVIAARRLYRLWPSRIAYLISTPVLLALLLLVFESVAGVLPATL